jgi:hypothetical protein
MSKELEDTRKGVQYDEWEMAIEVLDKAKKHIGAWEQQNLRQWLLADDGAFLVFYFVPSTFLVLTLFLPLSCSERVGTC